jgi:hypothetical protein
MKHHKEMHESAPHHKHNVDHVEHHHGHGHDHMHEQHKVKHMHHEHSHGHMMHHEHVEKMCYGGMSHSKK